MISETFHGASWLSGRNHKVLVDFMGIVKHSKSLEAFLDIPRTHEISEKKKQEPFMRFPGILRKFLGVLEGCRVYRIFMDVSEDFRAFLGIFDQ